MIRVANMPIVDAILTGCSTPPMTPKAPPPSSQNSRYLAAFVEDVKASGFVAAALARHGIVGAAVAPAAGGS
jgi:hypothetical protein